MSREILFRGKRLDNGEWIEGDGIHYPKSINYLGSCWIDGMGECANDWVQVDPATVGQFTGLCDKSGVTKIFEGDIIRLDGTIGGNIYEEKELLKDTTNLIIKGVGTSSWATTEQEAIMRGCHYAE